MEGIEKENKTSLMQIYLPFSSLSACLLSLYGLYSAVAQVIMTGSNF